MNRTTAALTELTYLSESAAENGDFIAAKYYIDNALELWNDMDTYVHMFITHAEIDALSDAFFDAAALLNDEASPAERSCAFSALRYHIDSIADKERVNPGSIF